MNNIFTLVAILSLVLIAGCAENPTEPGTSEPTSVYIHSVTASPTDSEQVSIKNNSGQNKDLSNWKLGDLNDPRAYNIPNGTLIDHGQIISIFHTTLGFQVNDSGETIFLIDAVGNTIDTWSN